MKKHFFIFVLLATMMGLMSCEKKNQSNESSLLVGKWILSYDGQYPDSNVPSGKYIVYTFTEDTYTPLPLHTGYYADGNYYVVSLGVSDEKDPFGIYDPDLFSDMKISYTLKDGKFSAVIFSADCEFINEDKVKLTSNASTTYLLRIKDIIYLSEDK